MSNLYIGIMSGTSLDGIDIALTQLGAKECKLLSYCEYKFPQELKKEILHLISNKVRLKQIGSLNTRLGILYADLINLFLKQNRLLSKNIEAIGLHGQTLWHEPESETPFSMQLGDANIVAAKTSIKVVSDFRNMDIANGGQGAPLTPAFHQFLFESLGSKVAVVNIGGISNITILGSNLRGWDCGPGNVLMDYWIFKSKKLHFDKNGKFANSGNLNSLLLENMLNNNYFYKEAPKSTGREQFNKKYLNSYLQEFPDIKAKDVQRTLLELTAKTIAYDVKNNKIEKLIVCGGGSKNKYLMKRLQKLCKIDVKRSDEYGVSSDFMEAMAFAWLAYKRVNKECVSLCSVTGAKKESVLGALYESC